VVTQALTKPSSRSTIGDSVPSKGKDPPVTALLTTNLGDTPLLGRGKVRDLYAIGDALLLVATTASRHSIMCSAAAFQAKEKSLRRFRCSGLICSRILSPIT
jgi:hypothetical protein